LIGKRVGRHYRPATSTPSYVSILAPFFSGDFDDFRVSYKYLFEYQESQALNMNTADIVRSP